MPTITPPNAPDLSPEELRAEIKRRMALIRAGRGAELVALPEPTDDAALDVGFHVNE